MPESILARVSKAGKENLRSDLASYSGVFPTRRVVWLPLTRSRKPVSAVAVVVRVSIIRESGRMAAPEEFGSPEQPAANGRERMVSTATTEKGILVMPSRPGHVRRNSWRHTDHRPQSPG